jgi:hypothetical protein
MLYRFSKWTTDFTRGDTAHRYDKADFKITSAVVRQLSKLIVAVRRYTNFKASHGGVDSPSICLHNVGLTALLNDSVSLAEA